MELLKSGACRPVGACWCLFAHSKRPVQQHQQSCGQPVGLAAEHGLGMPSAHAPTLPAVCRAVDEGTNPDSFTVQLFRDSLAQNQARCGRSCCCASAVPLLLLHGEPASGPLLLLQQQLLLSGMSALPTSCCCGCCLRLRWHFSLFHLTCLLLPCSKGKVEAFRSLREQLTQQLAAAFPATVADYQQLRAAPPPQQQQQQPGQQQPAGQQAAQGGQPGQQAAAAAGS